MNVLAKDYLERAKNRILDASSAMSRGAYPEVVRYSQECVELSLKAILRIVGVEYPKVHDVGDVVDLYRDKFPEWLHKHIEKFRFISTDLAQKRGPSLYGLERLGKPPSEIFDEEDAREALDNAKYVYEYCFKFFREFYGLTV
ncbi:MAG: HEPN domain-containing protein [Candidatus Methanomethylicia archaeon]|nr:HEPN domain-containing protein [Candidatus Methanomethylicia archaeon]